MKKFNSFKNTHPIISIINNSLIKLPTPSSISFWWNMGSILGICLMVQIITGLLLTMHYTPHMDLAFFSINHIYRNTNMGWFTRTMHANGASMFFFFMYLHIGRNIYYNSYNLIMAWFSGIIILFILMATAFMGYVLPWGQMSFWGATVITNLFSVAPYIGNDIVQWIWGNFTISNATLNRFFMMHFLLPFILMMFIIIHLMLLHSTGSSNPISINYNMDKIPFHPYFTYKDMLGFILMFMLLLYLMIWNPYLLSDPDNFILANPMVTPVHIQPEWYFLFAYAILRSIPNKMGGVLALLMSILILMVKPFIFNKKTKGNQYYFMNKILFFNFMFTFFILTWLGACPVEYPYVTLSQFFTVSYFLFYFMDSYISFFWNKLLTN
uniref:Cytochrome b n=1 Tax=Triaenodes qinglingensis TaxID=2904906 RepID=A0A9E8RV02_9NEOP|nr:cytochrome b [Triaenodes qinglingensis]UZZ44440.1 cytochrome b [Triaenodes qinglingensis]